MHRLTAAGSLDGQRVNVNSAFVVFVMLQLQICFDLFRILTYLSDLRTLTCKSCDESRVHPTGTYVHTSDQKGGKSRASVSAMWLNSF